MKTRKLWWVPVIVLAISGIVIGVNANAKAEKEKHHRGTIVGQVSDPSGQPLEGVTVSVHKKGPSTTTDAGGLYSLTGVKQKKRVVVNFEKAGYASTQGIAILKSKKVKDKDIPKVKGNRKLKQATLTKVMVPVGETQQLDADSGGTVEQNGFKVNFPPGSLDVVGNVDLVISPIDVSSSEILAFPGDFTGVAVSGGRVLMETFSLMDVDITQNGEPVQLRPGATAALEFLLPETTSAAEGDTIPLWFFNEAKGLWFEEGVGTVAASTSVAGRLAVFGEVSHFTWWNADNPIDTQTCLSGLVLDTLGDPVAGAQVFAEGVDYTGISYAQTNAAGQYCINVKRASTVELIAKFAFGNVVQQNSITVITSDMQMTCNTGGCTPVPTIILAGISCIEGDVRDAADNPIAGALVNSTAGATAITEADGSYCMKAPAEEDVTVFSSGFPPVSVTTPADGVSCASGVCANAPIREEAPAITGCLRGTVIDGPTGDPLPNAEVQGFLPGDIPAGDAATTDVSGNYCLSGLPAATELTVIAEGQNSCKGQAMATSSPAGNSCTAGVCVLVPEIQCFFIPQ